MSDDISEEGGIRSRVLGELSTLRAPNDVFVVARIRARNLHLAHKLRKEFESEYPQTKLRLVPVVPHGNYPLIKGIAIMADVLMCVMAGLLARSSKRFTSLYAHNLECALAGLALRWLFGIPLTADLHGDEVEESVTVSGWRRDGLRHSFWRMIQGIVVGRSDTVVCVSRAHMAHLLSTYNRKGRTEIIPCCVPEQAFVQRPNRMETLSRLGISDRPGLWVLYTGSTYVWQLLDKMATFVESLVRSGIEVNALLLISDPRTIPDAARAFSKCGKERLVIMSVPHRDVARISCIASAAMLFREEAILNRISSPTKFAEYLAVGTPVIITPNIGDYSAAVKEFRLGEVVELDKIGDAGYASEAMNRIKTDALIGNRCREYARTNLSWDSYSSILHEAFNLR